MEQHPLPVACTLDPGAVADRLGRWRALRPDLRWFRFEGGRLEARFTDGVAAELERLADAERTCCAWATWSVDGATLVVTGPAEALGPLADTLLGGPG